MEKEKIREKIIRGAVDLFMAYGIKSVTMDDIARHLSISKKTIYLYFKDKEEIVFLATQTQFEKEKQEMEGIERSASNAIEHLHKISSCMREKVRSINPSLLYDLERFHPEAWQVYQDYMRNAVFDTMIRVLETGRSQGYFRENINAHILARLRMEEIKFSFDINLFPGELFSLSEVHEQIFDHFIYGILTDKGLQLLHTYQQSK
jgi:AcrR family transcriptional regulator